LENLFARTQVPRCQPLPDLLEGRDEEGRRPRPFCEEELMSVTDWHIRTATPADAAALAAFAERTFREAFAADNNAADMDVYCLQAFSEATQRAELADPVIETLLVHEHDGALVAYAQLRQSPVPPEVTGPAPIELVRFYVDRTRHGSGVALRLMSEVVNAARARGAGTLWLGAWEKNFRAVAFYRKVGFVDVGAHDFMLGTDRQTDRLMARPV
jgi:diamine N-acetyltransferase